LQFPKKTHEQKRVFCSSGILKHFLNGGLVFSLSKDDALRSWRGKDLEHFTFSLVRGVQGRASLLQT